MMDDLKLIAEIKNHPLLYDPGVPENRDLSAKESTWAFIAKTLGYSVRECKMRWKSLRERFARERKKIIMNNQTDSFATDDEQDMDIQGDKSKAGTWHLMKSMYFLWNFVIHRNMNRSKQLFLSTSQDEQSNAPQTSMSAPIWLLPNVTNNNILHALQSKSMAHENESDDYGVIVPQKVKDPLCVDDENSVCFDIDTSDSEDESRGSKRECEDDTRSQIGTIGVKKIRRDIPTHSTSPNVAAHNDGSKHNDRLSRGNMIVMNGNDKNPTFSMNNDGNSNTAAMVNCNDQINSKPTLKCDQSVSTSTSINHSESHCQCKVKSEDELFCLSIAASMQRLSAKQRALLKLRIQQIMYEVEFPE